MYFPGIKRCQASLNVPVGHYYIFLCEVFVQTFCFFQLWHFFLLSCKSSLFILDTRPLSNVCAINIFSPCKVCLFYNFLNGIFQRAEFKILVKSKLLLFFPFMFQDFCALSKKHLPIPNYRYFSYAFFLEVL